MSGVKTRISDPAPLDYETPPFPSLYWPLNARPGVASYLYYTKDIWRFTLIWTLIFYAAFHIATAALAVCMQVGKGKSAFKWVWSIPIAYAVIAGIEAMLAGSIVGLILGAVYDAGYFRMSTWIPFVWSLINVLVLILSAFSIQGAL
ncbi:hypothetical protein VC83_05903 [Pseudogymnoascus destructans]|uniref:Integral membrane protein n=2 Tax=Pseudogymnoascus destructans TaxID=655981 RepID=L8G2I7_PSED2|nr:uncharacterized protein VC83_05903 [Pseudogymnoascus destructans]ELR06898.1 hypothetical protein GMDG_02268 [Pseudogymnoascus destructans 20631-21]OAF57063.1 hypothetical protein VC83_05903 [Pseudogymnoascus destructans]